MFDVVGQQYKFIWAFGTVVCSICSFMGVWHSGGAARKFHQVSGKGICFLICILNCLLFLCCNKFWHDFGSILFVGPAVLVRSMGWYIFMWVTGVSFGLQHLVCLSLVFLLVKFLSLFFVPTISLFVTYESLSLYLTILLI